METNSQMKKVWLYVLQDIVMTNENTEVTTASVYKQLEKEMKKRTGPTATVGVRFNLKSLRSVLQFIKIMGRYRTPQMAHALKNMFLMLPITSKPLAPKHKKVYLEIWRSGMNVAYESYNSIKKMLDVYGKYTFTDSTVEGTSAYKVRKQLKKEKNNEECDLIDVTGNLSIKISAKKPVNEYVEEGPMVWF